MTKDFVLSAIYKTARGFTQDWPAPGPGGVPAQCALGRPRWPATPPPRPPSPPTAHPSPSHRHLRPSPPLPLLPRLRQRAPAQLSRPP
eukprot:1712822-Rhodomonas_salina.1